MRRTCYSRALCLVEGSASRVALDTLPKPEDKMLPCAHTVLLNRHPFQRSFFCVLKRIFIFLLGCPDFRGAYCSQKSVAIDFQTLKYPVISWSEFRKFGAVFVSCK